MLETIVTDTGSTERRRRPVGAVVVVVAAVVVVAEVVVVAVATGAGAGQAITDTVTRARQTRRRAMVGYGFLSMEDAFILFPWGCNICSKTDIAIIIVPLMAFSMETRMNTNRYEKGRMQTKKREQRKVNEVKTWRKRRKSNIEKISTICSFSTFTQVKYFNVNDSETCKL